jgi:hypothetical protein
MQKTTLKRRKRYQQFRFLTDEKILPVFAFFLVKFAKRQRSCLFVFAEMHTLQARE